jgi:exosome complex component RRP45
MWRYGSLGGQPRASNGTPQSTIEQSFIVSSAIELSGRTDGRTLETTRDLSFSFFQGNKFGTVQCSLGNTVVIASVSAELTRPSPDRATEGVLSFSVELSKLCSAFVEKEVLDVQNSELSGQLERFIKEADAIDVETLCVVAGEKVWSLRCDVRVINDDGNVLDCCVLAAMAALRHFRLPQVSILSKTNVRVMSLTEREPLPLNVHRIPVPVTFGLLPVSKSNDKVLTLIDPTQSEEMVCAGAFTVIATASTSKGTGGGSDKNEVLQEICGLHLKNGASSGSGGASLAREDIQKCIQMASAVAQDLTDQLVKAVDEDLKTRQSRVLESRGLGPLMSDQDSADQ